MAKFFTGPDAKPEPGLPSSTLNLSSAIHLSARTFRILELCSGAPKTSGPRCWRKWPSSFGPHAVRPTGARKQPRCRRPFLLMIAI